MPLAATGVFEVRTAGNDSNAGYFNPGGGSPGTDWSQQDSPQITIDGSTITAAVHTTTTQINITGATVTSAWNRNGLRITGGTATAGLYEITAVDTGNNRITVDRSAGSSTQTVIGRVGGAMASLGQVGAFAIGQNTIWIRSGTYTISTASTNVSGGCFSYPAGSFDRQTAVFGYGSTRGDGGSKPVLRIGSGVSSATIITTTSNSYLRLANLEFDGNSQTTSRGVNAWNFLSFDDLNFRNFTNSAINVGAFGFPCHMQRIYVTGCSGSNPVINAGGTNAITSLSGSVIENNSSPGAFVGFADGCISRGNSGASSDGFRASQGGRIKRCTSHGNGRHGIFIASSQDVQTLIEDCILTNNGGWGIGGDRSFQMVYIRNCFTRSNTSGAVQNPTTWITTNTALTADPYVDAAGGNFGLNTTAGGGAVVRAAGLPQTWPGLASTVGYPDAGAVQSQATGSGGGLILPRPMNGGYSA